MKKYLFITLSIFIVGIGCSDQSNTKEKKEDPTNFDLTITNKRLQIPIDSLTPYESNCIRYLEEGTQSYLIFFNRSKNVIDFYDLDNKTLYNRINLQSEGPNSVGPVLGLDIHSKDSIFLTSMDLNLYMMDFQGNIGNKIPYVNIEEGIGLLQLSSIFNTNLAIIGGDAYGYTGLIGDFTSFDQEHLSKTFIETKINLSGDKIESLSMTFPKDYVKTGIKNFETSRIFDGERFIYSFCADHYLYSTKDFKNISKTLAKSKYFDKIGSMKKNVDIPEYQKYIVENPSYNSIVFDKYRKVYYRFCDLPIEYDETLNMDEIIKNRPEQSIIILDASLKIIGETLLPKKKFKLSNYFVNNDGLYVSNNTTFNTDMNEDTLSFTLLTLSKSE